jgi:hypothetical protein
MALDRRRLGSGIVEPEPTLRTFRRVLGPQCRMSAPEGYQKEVAMRALPFILVASLLVPLVSQAEVKPEIRPFVGAFVPTGDQRNVLNDAVLTGGQVAVEAANVLHLVGTFAFAGPNFDHKFAGQGHMHVYQSDVGAELFRNVAMNNRWKFRPFVGAGLGVRTYDPTSSASAKNYPAGYGALGAEFQLRRIAVRCETRDYLTRFKGVTGSESASTRNELMLSAGLAYHLR